VLANRKVLPAVAALVPLLLIAGTTPTEAATTAQPVPFQAAEGFGGCAHPLVPNLAIVLVLILNDTNPGNDVRSLSIDAPDAQSPVLEQPGTEVESIRVDYYNEEMRPELLIEGTQEKYSIYSTTKSAPTGGTTFAGKDDVGLLRVRVIWSKVAGATGKEVLTCYLQLPADGISPG
jgi:hypothetical protein